MSRPSAVRAFFRFHEKDASYFAGGIAFYLLFSLTPFLLLSLSLAALFARDSSHFVSVFDRFLEFNFPARASSLRDALFQVFERRGQIGLVGTLWLFLSARKLVNAMEIGLNTMLDMEKTKSTVMSHLVSIAFIFIAAMIFLAAVLATVAFDLVAGLKISFVTPAARSYAGGILSIVMGCAVSVALFFTIYRMAPARGMPTRQALAAALFATVMWQGARHVFVWFAASQLSRYQWLYGSLAGFLLLMTWAYVFAVALLMGACLVKK